MRRVINSLRPLFLGGLLLALPWALAAGKNVKPDPNGLAPHEVQDLHYGDVLFYFFQDDYFDSITRLLAAQQLGRIPHTQEEAELLLGGLYLSLGEHVEAGRIFEALLKQEHLRGGAQSGVVLPGQGLVSARLPGGIRARAAAGLRQDRSAHQCGTLHAAGAANDARGALR